MAIFGSNLYSLTGRGADGSEKFPGLINSCYLYHDNDGNRSQEFKTASDDDKRQGAPISAASAFQFLPEKR